MTDLNVAPVAELYRDAAKRVRDRIEAAREDALGTYVMGIFTHAPGYGDYANLFAPPTAWALADVLEEGAANGGSLALTELAQNILRAP